jgi:hypothetical protein
MTSKDFQRVLVNSASGDREQAAEISSGEQRQQRQRDASEAATYIRSIRMHWKSTEADRAGRADRASGEYKVSEVVKAVRTCQNSLGQDGTCLGLLLLHVGPNGDEFGGQAFMEHYIIVTSNDIGLRISLIFLFSFLLAKANQPYYLTNSYRPYLFFLF